MTRTVLDLFERQLRERPDAPAVRTAGHTWTYAEFGAATARLAARLRRLGAGPGDVVALIAPRSAEALTGVVGILRSGAACLPLDPDDPRNGEILHDTGCRHVVDASVLGDPALADEEVGELGSPHPLDLAYAITTSGSTGRPKVVGVPHEGLLNLMLASADDLDLIRPGDVMLWTLAVTVDSSMHDVLMPLCHGGTVAVPEAGELPATRMVHAVRALGATALEIPAAVLGPYGQVLLPRLAEAGVRLVITGGSQLDGPGLADVDGLVVANGYGPTETTVAPLWHRCGPGTPRWAPIGAPIRNTRAYVLDENLDPAPEGQLYIGGAGLARGYLGLPGRTAQVFVPDPFSGVPGARMYATGDRVRRRPDGEFVFVGRIDDQVKISGFRVEIGEVEHALRDCPGVVDAAVLVRHDAPGGAAIVAYLAGTPRDDLAETLAAKLPGHMLPRFHIWLDRLPLNRSGKVDRHALAKEPFTIRDKRTVVIIGGKPKLVRKAHELGLRVVYVQTPRQYDKEHHPYVDQALLLDYMDTATLLPLLRALDEAHPVDAVVSLYELGVQPAAEADRMLGLGGYTVETVELLLDKGRMRAHLNALDVSPVAAAVGENVDDLRKFVAEHGYPIFVKPVCEAGSIGVFAVRDEADLVAVPGRLRDIEARFDPADLVAPLDRFLMEEFLDGPEISVETLSYDGRHVVVGITDKVLGGPGFVEVGHSAPSVHPEEQLREATELVVRFLDAVGLRHGPGHTEVKLTARGPRVVEGHARIGGDRINELTEIAYGVDMDRHAIGARLGVVEPLTEPPAPRAGAAIRFLTPAPGRVVEITGVEEARRDPALVELEITVEPGGEVVELTWSDERVGYVLARGGTVAEAVANAERLAALVRIHTEAAP
uniref:AMP-binding protein n=1 Tax=Herbidospora sakaeratensis TaxID=564415 RepID=UPI000AFB8676|nr:AMP-binding protein [Herbidospora sakaeratensis]